MNYRVLGKTGLLVSEIGFGCWGIGGTHNGAVAYGPTEETQSLRALSCAFDRGINFYDTADFYGFGHSEYLIGKAFKDKRTKVIIASKGGMNASPNQKDFSPSYLRRSLEATLQRLQTDYLDLYQLHGPSLHDLDKYWDLLELFETLKSEGKIRTFGISVRSPEEGLEVVRKFQFPCIQSNFSLIDQRALDNGLFQLCAEKQVGVIGRTPLCFGYLTGQYTGQEIFPASDHRSRWSKLQVEKWVSNNQRLASLIPHDVPRSPSQFALQFCLAFEMVSTVIPGMLTEDQVNENYLATKIKSIPGNVLQEIRNIYEQSREELAISH